jgi:hypothetical protein
MAVAMLAAGARDVPLGKPANIEIDCIGDAERRLCRMAPRHRVGERRSRSFLAVPFIADEDTYMLYVRCVRGGFLSGRNDRVASGRAPFSGADSLPARASADLQKRYGPRGSSGQGRQEDCEVAQALLRRLH